MRLEQSLLGKYETMVSTHFTLYRVFVFQTPIGMLLSVFLFCIFFPPTIMLETKHLKLFQRKKKRDSSLFSFRLNELTDTL